MIKLFNALIIISFFMVLLITGCDSKKNKNFNINLKPQASPIEEKQEVNITTDSDQSEDKLSEEESQTKEKTNSDEDIASEDKSSQDYEGNVTVTSYDDEDSECNSLKADYLKNYKICRFGGSDVYYSQNFRGDIWGVGSKTARLFSIGGNHNFYNFSLWRSSYGELAPSYCQHGVSLRHGYCPLCARSGGYGKYAVAARYLDDGLYYYERGDYSRAYHYFSSPYVMRSCRDDNMLAGLIKSIQYKTFSKVGETVYNILDRINWLRYGCSYTYNFDTCSYEY